MGDQETVPTPVLWRVMELQKHGGDKPGAILLSHYLLEAMAYQGAVGGSDPDYVRPGTAIAANTWDGSEVQTWLNSAATERVKLGALDDYDNTYKGFLHADYFSMAERFSMVDYPSIGTKVVLPSGVGPTPDSYSLELAAWFGANTPANNNARKAHFKGGPSSFTEEGADAWNYWTRSPVSSRSKGAYGVYGVGTLLIYDVVSSVVAVRPAFFLNLESVIFKSAFDPTSAAVGGSRENPFVLYLASADKTPQSAVVSGDKLTVTFAATDGVVHAYTGAPNAAELAKRFTVTASGGAVTASSATVSADAVTLTLSRAVASDETVTAAYAHTAGCSDGLAFLSDATVLKSFAAQNVLPTYTIIATAGAGGTITPSGSVAVVSGDNKTFAISPNVDYVVADLLIDGVSAGAASSHTFRSVSSDHTIEAVFREVAEGQTYTITATAGAGGTITPSGDVTVASGGNQTFAISPDAGYAIDGLQIDGVGIAAASSYTFKNVSSDHTIAATFKKATERTFFSVSAADCEIRYHRLADGRWRVEVLIPFAEGSDPSLLATIRAIFSFTDYKDIEYSYVNADGTETKIPAMSAKSAARAAVNAPYLKIAFTMTESDKALLDTGILTAIEYTLTNAAETYTQNFPNGGLKFADIKKATEPTYGVGSSGVGCGTGAASLIALAALAALRKKTRKK
ncbi:DUF6273 domain-containing protein [Synergistaceae bacterium OttesenSCG-928-I11]|nr:DUF6273 domain-containing protein [Synergistaceae bacterium OttesenSCG-928-I11]